MDSVTETKVCKKLPKNHLFYLVAHLNDEATLRLALCIPSYTPGQWSHISSCTNVAEVHPVPLFPGQMTAALESFAV